MAGGDATGGTRNGGTPRRLTSRDQRIVFSPVRLVCLLTISIFVIETLIMELLAVLPGLPPVLVFFVDGAVLSLCILPVLYFFLFKPLLHLIDDYRSNVVQLRSYQEQLEQKVAERTQALDDTMRSLQLENAERRQVEAALRESEDRFHQLFEQSEDAIVLVSPADDAIIDVNVSAERLFGQSRDALTQDGVRCLCSAEGNSAIFQAIEAASREGASSAVDRLECMTIDGTRRILSFRGKPIRLGGETVIYTTFRDVTRRVRLEDEAREMQSRLIHANRMTSLGVLVSSVAHEINNPNNYILMNAALLKQAWTDVAPVLRERFEREGEFMIGRSPYGEAEHFLAESFDGILEGARRIGEIVNTLKDFGRDDRSGLQGTVDINAVVRLSTSILNHLITRYTDRFTLELAEGVPVVRGSARQLEQLVINLMLNALQSLDGPDQGVSVSTGTDRSGEDVLVRIRDEGCGIPHEIASQIMQPFFTTRMDRGGTGLGLSICSTIVRDHGGTLEFDSEPGKGTTFTVRLHRAEQTVAASAETGGADAEQ